jgi:AraC-like DNA-binding protein
MKNFIIDHNSFKQLLEEMAIILGGEFKNDVYTFPPHVASGYIRYAALPNGSTIIISNYVMNCHLTWQKIASLPEVYVLRMNFIEDSSAIDLNLENDKLTDKSDNYAAVLLTTSKYSLTYSVAPGTRVQSINLTITPGSLKAYFPGMEIIQCANALFLLKADGYNLFPMSYSSRQALLEVIRLPADNPFYILMLTSRIYEIAAVFFEQLQVKMKDEITPAQLADIEKITELDIDMMGDFSHELLPVEALAQKVFMSTAKFKNLFKKVYGQSVYEYYNASRLNKARRQIMLGELSIKEATYSLGFNNTAHFSAAFKKCFGFSPSDIKTQTVA